MSHPICTNCDKPVGGEWVSFKGRLKGLVLCAFCEDNHAPLEDLLKKVRLADAKR